MMGFAVSVRGCKAGMHHHHSQAGGRLQSDFRCKASGRPNVIHS